MSETIITILALIFLFAVCRVIAYIWYKVHPMSFSIFRLTVGDPDLYIRLHKRKETL